MSDANELGRGMADIRVLHGRPTDVEIAAVVVALTPTAGDEEHGDRPVAVPAWTRAALAEGTGGARVSAPAGLQTTGR